MNHNGKGHVLPTLIQFHVHRTGIVKVTFNRNSGERLAPDTQFTAASWKGPPACPGSAHTSCLSSWTPARHSVTDGSYSKCMWQATRDGIFGSRQCLVLVAWPRILLFRVVQIGVKKKKNNLTVFLPPLPEVQCPNFLDFQNPWGKVLERSGLRFEDFCS